MAYRHVALIRLHDELSDAEADAALAGLRSQGDAPGIMAWRVEPSIDARKGRVLIDGATFPSGATFEAWRAGPARQDLAARMVQIADWLVGDYPFSE